MNGKFEGSFKEAITGLESSVEEPTRPRDRVSSLVKNNGPKIDTTRFAVEDCTNVQYQEKQREEKPTVRPPLTAFEQELRRVINRYYMENGSYTPDNILAEYLSACLNAFNIATTQRERWYGRKVF